MKNLLRALRYFQPDSGRIAFAFALLLLSTAFNLLKPWPLAVMIDSILGAQPHPPWLSFAAGWSQAVVLALLSVSIFMCYVAHGVLTAGQNFVSIQVGLRGLARVRTEVFHWLQRLSLRFHQGTRQGDVIYRASWDTFAFQTLFQQGVFTFAQATLALGLMAIVMGQLNARLTLVCLATVPLLVVTMKFFGRGMKQRSLAAHQADSQLTSFVQQTIAALPLIQSFTREASEESRFAERVASSLRQRTAQHGWEVIYWLGVALGFGLGVAAITWLGTSEVLSGRLSLGQLTIFLAYLAQFYEPLTQLSHLGTTLSDASAGTQRVFELLDAPGEIKEAPNARPVVRDGSSGHGARTLIVRGGIRFENVSFGYDASRPVLRDIQLEIQPGESVAIIGPSGTGKTTLLQLVPRFYDPTSGLVRLDGVDLRELRVKDLREQISFVPQEPILLPATLAENIAYGKPNATRAQVEAAARAAHAAEFIERLPQSYDTVVGEGAARLSVGEKQRINLARAFLKDAPILILDEPTSALDAESEALVMESLRALMRDRTALIVAHRLATLRGVARIVVLEAGRITDVGAPEELKERSGYYQRMIASVQPD